MPDDWTPSTEQVRSHYVFNQTDQWDAGRGEAFDRWIAALRSEWEAEQGADEPEWEYGIALFGEMDNVQPWATEERARREVQDAEDITVRRRKAGPWESVPASPTREEPNNA